MRLIFIGMVLFGALTAPALAHTAVGPTDSFGAGFAHPFGGADHLIAITLVGLWSVLAGGRAIIAWPVTFGAAMLGGFAAASAGLQISFVEAAICLSVVLLGAFIALEVRVSVMPGISAIGILAFFHGHAHGTEAAAAKLVPYAAGFTLATAVLLFVGMGTGFCAGSLPGTVVVRTAGGCAALIGLSLLGGLA
ncbi:HupE/UreJ family protein [Bradyrhizobium iriomotense]|uniref:Protein hupE n=1 Tax=Bradyrhizobium iriomotense TaxID=441950 RepID=A0ABQ6BAH5_9BRAD|nr:HupE/UreJ family protein [Bradyrhizobium iriomotense]GLR90851.1 protein hupE [Bradyrhizobium iriomotense]